MTEPAMSLSIKKYGDPVLRRKSVPVRAVDGEMEKLASEMLRLMHKSKGVGLAAQQVGRTERLCVIDIPSGCENEEDEAFNSKIGMPLVMFNPEILSTGGSQRDKEGCLSFPGVGGSVTRAAEVTCNYVDISGKRAIATARGFLARAMQHEIDHLDGILYVDRMTEEERRQLSGKLKKLSKANGGTV